MTSKTLIQFGISVRQWRKDLGYNQEELGKLVGVSKQYISNIERAEPSSYTGEPTQPSIEVVDGLAKALRRPIQEMRDLAGYGIEKTSGQEEDRETKAARMAKMIQNWSDLSPEKQDQLLAIAEILKSDHPELLQAPIEIIRPEDLTASDVEEIEEEDPSP